MLEAVGRVLTAYRGALEDQSPSRRHRARRWMKEQLEALEKYQDGGVFDPEIPDSWEDDGR